MGIVFGIIVIIGTVLWCLLMSFANSMSDAPSSANESGWGTLVTGLGIGGLLIASHWMHLSW